MLPFPNVALAVSAGGAQLWTWSATDKDGDITLSNGNRTATDSSSTAGFDGAVRGVSSKSSGIVYFELVVGVVNGAGSLTVGFDTAAANIGGPPGASGATDGLGWDVGGTVKVGGAAVATYAALAAGDRLGFALDFVRGKVWLSKNGVWQSGSPATGTGGLTLAAGTYFPMAYCWNTGSVTVPAAALYTPSGFTPF